MTLLLRNQSYIATVSSPDFKRISARKISVFAQTSHQGKGWLKSVNLYRALGTVMLLVLVGIGGYAYSEHAKLQTATAGHEQGVAELTQQVQQTSALRNELDSVNQTLANTSAKLTTDESALAGVNQRLSTYGFSGPISEFASYDALIAWLKTDNTHLQLYSPTFQCVDFAAMMSGHAIQAGYWIFPAVDMANGHMKCIAPIGSDLYAIEPQTNDVILWAKKSY
jgi:hypothetical protein